VSAPAAPAPIPIAKPVLGEPEVEAAARAIRSGWVTQGPEVAAFEREFAAYVGAPHAVAVSSATTALHLALLAVGVRPGDEVVTVSHSFIATANVIRYCGALPVFVDVEPGTFNLDPALLAGALSPRTRAVLCVHQMGMPCDVAAILEVARPRGIAVVEDAACAVGSDVRRDATWERIGRPHGDLACFSFHPRKLVATGDGGMITTSSAEHDAKLRLLRQHGMSVPDTARHASRSVVFESYDLLGFNYRMTDIQAAVGREQLKRLPAALERRRALADRYLAALAGVGGLRLPAQPPWARTNWQSFCAVLPERVDQREVMQRLLDGGISTRRAIMNAHREAAYPAGTFRCAPGGLRVSEHAQDHGVLLPLFHDLTEAQQDRVIEGLRLALS
jgi:dTDP-4-amino-4,6-dideoxygalactose transaminase